MNGLKVFSGNANLKLAQDICDYLTVPLGQAQVTKFADGEINVQINENIRGTDCFIIQPTCPPVNDNLMELLIMIDALSRASARRITAVLPYYGYGRQDRKVEPRVPITAKLVANLIVSSGVSRLLVLDLHAGQIQGFFDIPVDHLYSTPVLVKYFKKKNIPDIVVVSPDAGGVERARAFAKRLEADLAVGDKRRSGPNQVATMNIIGNVEGKNAIIFDDMIDTAGSLIKVVEALKREKVLNVYAVATHPVLSGTAIERINNSAIKKLIVTDSIILSDEKKTNKIKVLSVAELLGEAIARINKEESVSTLFI
ncbi:ribose-phosphate pyrophosphokinase [bacterium]|nr:ribose-phosphate pyrophosphokinase [bacterium]